MKSEIINFRHRLFTSRPENIGIVGYYNETIRRTKTQKKFLIMNFEL